MRFRSWPIVCVCVLSLTTLDAQRPAPGEPADFAARQEAWERHQELARESLFGGLEWRSVGPVVQGGRVVDVEAVPGEPFSFYVAYASGGLWKTTNNGHSFEPLFDAQPTIVMGDLAVDPRDPKILWVGTGENNSSRSSYGGYGVFRSDDGGASWKHRGLGESDRIGRIVVDPRDSRRVFVAALGKLYTTGGERGVYRTVNGGESWEAVLPGKGYTGAIDLVIDPSNPDVLYAATWERSRRPWNFVESGPGSGIWKSTDGGTTWKKLAGGLPAGEFVGRIGLSIAASQPRTLYACVDNQELLPESDWDLGDDAVTVKRLRNMTKEELLAQDPDVLESFIRSSDLDTSLDAESLLDLVESGAISLADLIAEIDDANASLFQTDIRGLEVYRSDDGGESWRRTHEEPLHQVVHTYGYYFGILAVAPDDPDVVYTGGVPLIRSDDGGKTWSGILGRDVHVDHHEIWIDGTQPQRIILGNDGGIDISYDRGDTWRSVDTQPVGQFYTIELDMEEPYNIYGGLQDNGTLKGSSRSRPGRDAWSFIGGGDGMYVQVDSRDGTTYLGYQFGFYTRIDPSGTRRSVRPRDALKDPAYRYNWATPIQLSSHNEDILYFGTNRLFRSMDRGETWTALSGDLSRASERGDVPFACITTMDESSVDFSVIWAATDDGLIHVTETGGQSWREAAAGIVRDRWVSRIVASQHERNRAYVSLSGYRDDDISSYVYVTEDLGKTWRWIAGGLPSEPVNVVKEDPVQADLLYVGTDRGVYVSIDRGKAWQALAAGLPSVPVHDLVVHPRDRELVAGTHGRSVYVLDALPIQELVGDRMKETVRIFPVANHTYSRSYRSRRSRWFHRPEDDPRISVPFWAGVAGRARLEVLDEDDRVLRILEEDVARGVRVFEWDLLLDEERAVAAELAALEARKEASEEPPEPRGQRAATPWAEAIRLEHPLYVTPGNYTLRLTLGDGPSGGESTTDFEVDPPEEREPRAQPKPVIRGEKED